MTDSSHLAAPSSGRTSVDAAPNAPQVEARMLTHAEVEECRGEDGTILFLLALGKFCAVNRIRIATGRE